MLAEMFMLRLEAIARPSQDRIGLLDGLCRLIPLPPIEFKNELPNRRS